MLIMEHLLRTPVDKDWLGGAKGEPSQLKEAPAIFRL